MEFVATALDSAGLDFLWLSCFSYGHPIKNSLFFSYIIWDWVWSQPQKIHLATKPIKECLYHTNTRTELCVLGLGNSSLTAAASRLSSFSALFLVFLFRHTITSTATPPPRIMLKLQVKREGHRGNDKRSVSWLCLCLLGKREACSEGPSSKLPLVSCGPEPRHKVKPKGKEECNTVWLDTWPLCTKSVSCWPEWVLPVPNHGLMLLLWAHLHGLISERMPG